MARRTGGAVRRRVDISIRTKKRRKFTIENRRAFVSSPISDASKCHPSVLPLSPPFYHCRGSIDGQKADFDEESRFR